MFPMSSCKYQCRLVQTPKVKVFAVKKLPHISCLKCKTKKKKKRNNFTSYDKQSICVNLPISVRSTKPASTACNKGLLMPPMNPATAAKYICQNFSAKARIKLSEKLPNKPRMATTVKGALKSCKTRIVYGLVFIRIPLMLL